MVYQDYELIHSDRLSTIRSYFHPYYQRFWYAMGGMGTMFFSGFSGYFCYSMMHFNKSDITVHGDKIFHQGTLNRQYLSKFFIRGGIHVFLPAMIGFQAGMSVFGDRREFWNLMANRKQYWTEMDSYHKDFLYGYGRPPAS